MCFEKYKKCIIGVLLVTLMTSPRRAEAFNRAQYQVKALNELDICQGCPLYTPVFGVHQGEASCMRKCTEKRHCYFFKFKSDTCLLGVPSMDLSVVDTDIEVASLTIDGTEQVFYKVITRQVPHTSGLTHNAAISDCTGRGGYLATIYSNEEWAYVKSNILNAYTGNNIWVNLVKNGNGQFVWANGGYVDSSLWWPGEPNGDGYCVHFTTSGANQQFNDLPCDNTNVGNLCEFF